jgi:hypothetical protein
MKSQIAEGWRLLTYGCSMVSEVVEGGIRAICSAKSNYSMFLVDGHVERLKRLRGDVVQALCSMDLYHSETQVVLAKVVSQDVRILRANYEPLSEYC